MDENRVGLDPLGDPEDGHILTRAIIDTIHEPLIVLDENLRIIAASDSFYKKFKETPESTIEKLFYDLGDGQWNIASLRTLLEKVIPERTGMFDYEVEHHFPIIGFRVMLINAREIRYENGRKKMLLSILDVTDHKAHELERNKLLEQKDLLLKEMRHRIANSLQLIASILVLKAATVESKESKTHLIDAHDRILSVANIQQQLDPVYKGEDVPVSPYLQALCTSLARSMVGDRRPISIQVEAAKGMVSSTTAISFGLITTELVINSLKHAFPHGGKGVIQVVYAVEGSGWTLSVEDNGVGETKAIGGERPGLGTSIIGALANQLQAIIRTESSPKGTKVSILHANL